MATKYKDIDEYIKDFSIEIQKKLNEIRDVIKEVVPEVTTEKISWNMPTFYLYGNLVHFAGFKKHLGFYIGTDEVELFKEELKGFEFSKGGIRFPYDKTLPKEIIRKIVNYRVKQNIKWYEEKQKRDVQK